MMPGVNMKTNTNVMLPLAFIIYGLLAFAASQFILLFHTDLLLMGSFRTPSIWMATHFLLLGFAVMVVMGAMYQLVPVAFLTPIWSQKFGLVQFVVTIIGFTSFILLIGLAPGKAVYGGMLAVIGVLMFLLQMFLTIIKQQNKNMMTAFVMSALVCFFLTVIAGFTLAWSLTFGSIDMHQAILQSHLAFGITGWFTLLIFAFSYKLVPMFSLSHGFTMKGAKPAFFLYISGLVMLIMSFLIHTPMIQVIGWALLLVGYSCFVVDIRDILKKRIKRKLDKPFSFSILAIFIGLAIHVIAFIIAALGITNATVWSWLILLYLVGWIIFSILGYLYKIVPFLWWTHKYSDRIGKVKVPTMAEMINEKLSIILFILFMISLAGLVLGAILQIGAIILVFQVIITGTTIAYVVSIIKVLFV